MTATATAPAEHSHADVFGTGLPRTLEVVAVTAGLIILSPLLAVLALLVRSSSPGPALFRQQRIGVDGTPFTMLKLRTMYVDADRRGGALTVGARDPRVTPVGAALRRHKLDELPQLINVLRGHMRLVGPRPEVAEFVRLYTPAQRAVLAVPPGITDPASLAFYREEELLAAAADPRATYVEHIMPSKLELNLAYLRERTWRADLGVIARTLLRAFVDDERVPPVRVATPVGVGTTDVRSADPDERSGTTHGRAQPDAAPAAHAAAAARPRVAIVTNGNHFANLALRHLLARTASSYEHRVFVTTGLRRQHGNRLVELRDLVRRWGLRYFAYKVATYGLPALAQIVLRRPFFVAPTATALGVPVDVVRNINDDEPRAALRAFAPDIVLSFSCPYRIGNDVLDIPTVGSLNVHSSLLPRYAGVCTYIHVLADDEPRTGVTVHEMVERFDAGRIVAQREVPIGPATSVFALFSTQCRRAGPLLVDAIARCLREGTIPGEPQDASQRTYRGEPTRDDIARLRAHGHRLLRPADLATLLRREPLAAEVTR